MSKTETLSKEKRLELISEIMETCREKSGVEDEEVLGARFYEMLDMTDDLLLTIHKLAKK